MFILNDKYLKQVLSEVCRKYPYIAGGIASQMDGIEFIVDGEKELMTYKELGEELTYMYSIKYGFQDSSNPDLYWVLPQDLVDKNRLWGLRDWFQLWFKEKTKNKLWTV